MTCAPLVGLFLAGDLQAADGNRITFSPQDAARPFLTEDNAMWESFEPAADEAITEDHTAKPLSGCRAPRRSCCPAGVVDHDVATKLLTSRRTSTARCSEKA